MNSISPAEFMATAPAPPGGNTPWAARYAGELRRVFHDHAARSPRTLQQHLGPSELGVECDRQVAGKLAALPATNHITDPWPSIRGTAMHVWAADAFTAENGRRNVLRWIAEQRVTPHPEHPGTADLYDAWEKALVDHKFLGDTTLQKLRRKAEPPRKYRVQLHLYGRGYVNLGLPVKRVVLAAYPATKASMDDMYVWEESATDPEAVALTDHVLAVETPRRKAYAARIAGGEITLKDVPASTDDDECYFCPFYRPKDSGSVVAGCPGARPQAVANG